MRAHVSCAISEGDLPVTFQWLKDQETIGPNLGIVIRNYDAQTQSLSIENVGSTHSGNYTCVVRNKAGTASHTAVLYVRVRPKIVPIYLGEGHLVGSPARLVCGLIEGDPPVSFQWLKDGLPIRDNMTSSSLISIHQIDGLSSILTIGRLVAEHTGSFTCIASNSAGSTNYTVQIKVNGKWGPRTTIFYIRFVYVSVAPKIVPFAFQGDHVFEGALARLTCVVYQGDLPLKINWMKDGITIPTDLGASIHQIDTYTSILTIDHVELKHGGNYTCIAQNQAAATRHTASLVVNEDHLVEGMLARVSCVVSRGDLPIQMRWEKDGSAIVSGSLDGMQIKSFDDHSSILSIVSVKTLHNGRYSCIASNEAGTAVVDALLNVKVPPKWMIIPKNVIVSHGQSALFDCVADGFPKPKVSWFRKLETTEEGLELEQLEYDQSVKLLSNGSLFIPHPVVRNSGSYYCKVSNGIGLELNKAVELQVQVPPQFKQKTQIITIKVNRAQTLSCTSDGDKPLTITWFKNNQQLQLPNYRIKTTNTTDGIVSELAIVKITRKDNGTYSCTAKNSHGVDEAIIDLVVLERPDEPKGIKVIKTLGREIQIKWTVPFSGNSPINKYTINYSPIANTNENEEKIISGIETEAVITGLFPATSYTLQIFAENKEGRSKPMPSGSPQGIHIDSVDHETIKVTWKPPEKSTWNGRLLGYNIGFKMVDNENNYSFKTLLTADPTASNMSVQISGMKQQTRYSVVVQAYNNKGKGPQSEPVMIMTAEGAPSEAPKDLHCTTLTSTSIHVTWNAPPLVSINGILKGYKLIYKPTSEWFGSKNDMHSFIEDTVSGSQELASTTITVTELRKFTNYSIQVLANTKTGDGPLSDAIFCKTSDDVPEQVRDIKAIVASKESIIISWIPPENPNGILLSYTIYWQNSRHEKNAQSHSVTADHQNYEVTSLRSGQQYEFWVTSSTLVGEGKASRKVLQTTSGSLVAAKIINFGSKMIASWKSDVNLKCNGIGNPEVVRKWNLK
ncbi:Down syndrome cell adhesion molecule-like protein 1 [Chamberlinius hualienensis]